MTKDDIIRMAMDASVHHVNLDAIYIDGLEEFAALVAAAEREACAEICDQQKLVTPEWIMDEHYNEAISHCAAAIRARGDK